MVVGWREHPTGAWAARVCSTPTALFISTMCDRTCHLQLTAPPNAAPFGAHIVPSGSSALLVSSRDALLHSRIQAAACAAGPRPPGPTPGIGQPANYDSIRRAGACSHVRGESYHTDSGSNGGEC